MYAEDAPLDRQRVEKRSASDRRKSFTSGQNRAATETFHIIEPLVEEKRFDIYHGENEQRIEEEHKRDEVN